MLQQTSLVGTSCEQRLIITYYTEFSPSRWQSIFENSYSSIHSFPIDVDTLEKFPFEELDTHDGEHQPEEETHEEDIEDGWDRVHQGIHHNLFYNEKI